MTIRNLYRKSLNNVMLSLTGVCAFLCVSTLFVILAYLVYNGGKSVDFAFFTQLPKSTGEEGGGMANAIVGSAEIVAIASFIGLPIGFFTGDLPFRMGRRDVFILCSLHGGPAEWRSIGSDRNFHMDRRGETDAYEFGACRGCGPQPIADSDYREEYRTVPARSTPGAARRFTGTGCAEVADYCIGCGPGGTQGHHDRELFSAWPASRAKALRCFLPVSTISSGARDCTSRPLLCP